MRIIGNLEDFQNLTSYSKIQTFMQSYLTSFLKLLLKITQNQNLLNNSIRFMKCWQNIWTWMHSFKNLMILLGFLAKMYSAMFEELKISQMSAYWWLLTQVSTQLKKAWDWYINLSTLPWIGFTEMLSFFSMRTQVFSLILRIS